ncbi:MULTISPECIES: shikimate dehydrogenase [unclassified Acidovorax]|uniref:shikimate dehydrogenase family protein n=1 Tax=unclassified Acidovorax TaxID=2684926 RepID=UPI0028834188|nr:MULTISPECIES: shikimate dehydrogenase [unclassified Acidovorax]
MISGKTTLIAHIDYPTAAFKAPLIYNPWFERQGIDAAVIPMGVRPEDYAVSFRQIFRFTNVRGALITMPHKVTTMALVDEATPIARIAGACNAVLLRPDGTLLGDQFDGAGFVRGAQRKGCSFAGARVVVAGCGGVGSAIAASAAAAGAAELMLFDVDGASAQRLAERLREHYPRLYVKTGSRDPAGFGIVVNATPLGMQPSDPLPFDVDRIDTDALVGEVVMATEQTPLLQAALARGCRVQPGTDMLFEMAPAYLEFFGFGTATPEALRAVAQLV